MAGGEYLSFNKDIFLSERETADRNYSLAYHMKEKGAFPEGFRVQECMDFYFKVRLWFWLQLGIGIFL